MSFMSYRSDITLFVVEEGKQENTPNRKAFVCRKPVSIFAPWVPENVWKILNNSFFKIALCLRIFSFFDATLFQI
jgi:hypothetical protein